MKKRILSLLAALTLLKTGIVPAALAAPVSMNTRTAAAVAPNVDDFEWEVLRLVNIHRMDMSIEPFTVFNSLQQCADKRADELTTLFSHSRPDGRDCYTVLDEFGISGYYAAGENIAGGQNTPDVVMHDWLNSPTHRGNIEENNFTHLSVGNVNSYWTQEFIGGSCNYTGLSLSTAEISGSGSLADLLKSANITVTTTCSAHGTCTMPLIANMCSGYKEGTSGEQEITISVYGQTAALTINSAEPEPTPTPEPEPEPTPTPEPEPEPTYDKHILPYPWPAEDDNLTTFKDVADHWARESIAFVCGNGLFAGTSTDTFSPNANMSRAMLVTVLARMANVDTSGGDVWYEAGRDWAIEMGISDGSNMEDVLTREQLVTMLYRAAKVFGIDTGSDGSGDLRAFADADSVSPYAEDAVCWAIEKGILRGVSENLLSPRAQATRAHVAVIIERFCSLLPV